MNLAILNTGVGDEVAKSTRAALQNAGGIALAPPPLTLDALETASTCPQLNAVDSHGPYPILTKEKRSDEYRLWVVSTGGSGTTYMLGELHDRLVPYGYTCNNPVPQTLSLKHMYGSERNTLKAACWQPDRIIYVFNGPTTSILSLVRRGFLSSTRFMAPWDTTWSDLHPEAFNSCSGFGDEVVKQKRDIAGRHQHMVSWLAFDVPAPTLFIDMNTALSHPSYIADFLGVPHAALASLAVKERSTTEDAIHSLPTSFTTLYDTLYRQMRLYDKYIRWPVGYQDRVPEEGLSLLPVVPKFDPCPKSSSKKVKGQMVCDGTPEQSAAESVREAFRRSWANTVAERAKKRK